MFRHQLSADSIPVAAHGVFRADDGAQREAELDEVAVVVLDATAEGNGRRGGAGGVRAYRIQPHDWVPCWMKVDLLTPVLNTDYLAPLALSHVLPRYHKVHSA